MADFLVGDIVTRLSPDYGWVTYKILEVEADDDVGTGYHCLVYEPTAVKPTEVSFSSLDILAFHIPIANIECERIANVPVVDSELIGLIEYRRLTSPPVLTARAEAIRAEWFGRSLRSRKSRAKRGVREFTKANEFCNLGDHEGSIRLHTKAVRYFPLLFESLDNRGLELMNLARFEEAIDDFRLSLEIEPFGETAFFSEGECLFKLGRFDEAEKIFERGVERFPANPLFAQFLERVRQR